MMGGPWPDPLGLNPASETSRRRTRLVSIAPVAEAPPSALPAPVDPDLDDITDALFLTQFDPEDVDATPPRDH